MSDHFNMKIKAPISIQTDRSYILALLTHTCQKNVLGAPSAGWSQSSGYVIKPVKSELSGMCGVLRGWWCIQALLVEKLPICCDSPGITLESWIHFKWGLPPLHHRWWPHFVTKYTTHVADEATINKLERLVSRSGECGVLIQRGEQKYFIANDNCEKNQQFVSISPLFSSNGWNLYFKISEQDWWMSIIHTCVIFNWNERTRETCVSVCPPPCWFLMSKFSDELSARLANIRTYNHECVKMCPGLRDCHETPDDMWHYTGRGRGGKCYCVLADMWPQSGPIVPAPASSGQTEYFMRVRVTGEGWFNGRCFIKIELLHLTSTQWNLKQGWNFLFMMSKGNLIKKKLSFLFVPTWDHHVFVDFSRLSTVKVRELHDEKIVIVFSLYICICLSVRDEK